MKREEIESTYLFKKMNKLHPKLGILVIALVVDAILAAGIASFIFFPSGILLLLLGHHTLGLHVLASAVGLYCFARLYRSVLTLDADKAAKKSLEIPAEILIVLLITVFAGYLWEYFPFDSIEHAYVAHKDDEFKLNTVLGAMGDYFGGTLNPILSFLTILILIFQNWRSTKREDARDVREEERVNREIAAQAKFIEYETAKYRIEVERDKKNDLLNRDKEFFRDLELSTIKMKEIKLSQGNLTWTGKEALRFYSSSISRRSLGFMEVKDFAVTLEPVAEIFAITLKQIYQTYISENSIPAEKDQAKKHYEYLKSTMPYDFLQNLAVVLKQAAPESFSNGEKLIVDFYHFCGSKNSHQYLKLKDENLIKEFMMSSSHVDKES